MNPSIIGWSHLPFGRRDDTLEEMIISVARGAIADAPADRVVVRSGVVVGRTTTTRTTC